MSVVIGIWPSLWSVVGSGAGGGDGLFSTVPRQKGLMDPWVFSMARETGVSCIWVSMSFLSFRGLFRRIFSDE